MEKLVEKMGLYDFFARLITGLTILVSADFFGILDWLHPKTGSEAQTVLYLIVGGYFLGILFEEVLYWPGHIKETRRNKEKLFPKLMEIPEIKAKKVELIGAGHEHLIEAPLIHVVMSGCYVIAFGLFSILCFLRAAFGLAIGPGNQFSDWLNFRILVFLTLIFALRRYHYRARRIELIGRYHEAYCKKDVSEGKEEKESETVQK